MGLSPKWKSKKEGERSNMRNRMRRFLKKNGINMAERQPIPKLSQLKETINMLKSRLGKWQDLDPSKITKRRRKCSNWLRYTCRLYYRRNTGRNGTRKRSAEFLR